MKRRYIIFSFIALVITLVSGYSLFYKKTITNLQLLSLQDGKKIPLENLCHQSGKKPLFINFWATWCPVCKSDIDAISTLARKHANIVFISTDHNISTVKDFINEKGHADLSMYNDSDGKAMRFFKVRGLPTTLKVDSSCQVVDSHIGSLTPSSIALFFDVRLKDI